jgi:hypothetical protein
MNKLKCLVANTISKQSISSIELVTKPSIGDVLPVHFGREKVVSVVFVTEYLLKYYPDYTGLDLVIYTE